MSSLISIKDTQRKDLFFYQIAKLLIFSIYSLSLASIINLKKMQKIIVYCLAFGLLWQSVLSWLQFFYQHSLALWFLGERTFSLTTPAIAKVDLSGVQVLRPYGTFPHPSVLAGFFALALIPISIYGFSNTAKKFNWILILIFVIGVSGLMISFSRTAWLTYLISITVYLLLRLKKKEISFKKTFTSISNQNKLIIILAFSTIAIITFPFVWQRILSLSTTDLHSVELRKKLIFYSIELFKSAPVFGIGQGHFLIRLKEIFQIEELTRFYQPVHNIFLLRLTETGIVGLFAFLALLGKTLQKLWQIENLPASKTLIALISSIILIGFFDHYFVTLEQGQVMFWTIIGLSWSLINASYIKNEQRLS
jgi:O-antigen ligase